MRHSHPLGQDMFPEKKRGVIRGAGRRRASTQGSAAAGGSNRRTEKAAKLLLEQRAEVIRDAITNRSFETHFQPIVDLRSGRAVGVEALSRFGQLPVRAPDKWFAEAANVGLGVELELSALESALEQLHLLPPGVYLSLNASIETMMTDEFQEAIGAVASERIMLELTEHTKVGDFVQLAQRIEHLRSKGVRVAVDDAGAGYSGLTHILNLKPDVIKLDISLTRGIDKDPARRALGRALLSFGLDAYNATLVAEGIETKGEYETLRSLGCPNGQGYLLGRPALLVPPRHVQAPTPLPLLLPPEPRSVPSLEVVQSLPGPEDRIPDALPSELFDLDALKDAIVAS
jgi:EAL domain-containing protein (putative c-di-GMP-specific phosphodiesterase class I)